jgi:hypothetical protein
MGTGIYFKIAGWVDLDMPHIDAVHQPTWPLLLKIEHMVKSQVLGKNSKTVNNIKNLTWERFTSKLQGG